MSRSGREEHQVALPDGALPVFHPLPVERRDVRAQTTHDPVRFGQHAALDVFVQENLVLSLCVAAEALLLIQFGKLDVRVEIRGIELLDPLPELDGLQETLFVGERVRGPCILSAGLGDPVQTGQEVTEPPDHVDVAGIAREETAIDGQRLLHPPGLLQHIRLQERRSSVLLCWRLGGGLRRPGGCSAER